nr:SNARE-interacting protein KEULE-like [Tanacetum cinerariifolium]
SAYFFFIIGGATRLELRVCHKLTTKLLRKVVLGSSSLDDPQDFITVSSFSICRLNVSKSEAEAETFIFLYVGMDALDYEKR